MMAMTTMMTVTINGDDDEEDEKSGGVFLDASAMKEKIRQAAFKKERA